ncbi:MAG: extracellular solute-binding protein [Chloroflexi bacterium]|nr:extracellular solute-binding protein [Chloroflexota bacterium]
MRRQRPYTIVCILISLAFILSACAPAATAVPAGGEKPAATSAATSAATAAPATSAAAVNPAGQFPIVNDKITLTVLLVQTNGVSDYVDNEFTKWLEEKTNIHLEFDIAPMAQAENRQKLNLVLASGKLPDIIMNFSIPLDQQQTLADQGLIVPVDDLIEKYGDEFKTVMEEFPQIKDVFSLADGKMYSLPHINDCYHCNLSQKAWIYKPWLDKLGLEVPTTTDELYTVLKAFKEQDPNGNGIADEVPWSGAQTGSWHAALDQFIMNSFVLNSSLATDSNHMYIEDGEVKAAYAQPGWKEGLIYLNKLYNEGLIDPQVFTNDMTQHKALGENPEVAVMGFTQAGWPGMFLDWMGPSNRWQEYVPVGPLKGPSGLQQIPENPYGFGSTGAFIITKDCKNPEAAYRLADLMYSYEATMRSVYGRPGIEWVESEPGAESITGTGEPRYNVLVVWSEEEQNVTWQQAAPTFRDSKFRLEWQEFNPDDPLERSLYQWSRDIYAPYGKPDMQVPPLAFTSEQSQELGTLSTALTTYVDQMFASFVTGQVDINTGWDQYLSDLKTNGLDKYLQIYQAAYDAKYK